LKSDQIGDLHLVLPNTANGESKLTIKLISPDDAVIADAETILKVASAPIERAGAEDSVDATPAVGAIQNDDGHANRVQPSAFVNLRDGPSSSAKVVGVIAKGARLPVMGRKRGWVQVTNPATSEKGWIYSGFVDGAVKGRLRTKRTAPAEPEQKSESFWSNVAQWLSPSP
jgi:uncharacterized protein YgiM (DUF1202 family)